jgi:hypothetical protein
MSKKSCNALEAGQRKIRADADQLGLQSILDRSFNREGAVFFSHLWFRSKDLRVQCPSGEGFPAPASDAFTPLLRERLEEDP